LAFARKQIIAPKVLNLNLAVENMLQMLRRLIGEDIDLVWHPDTGLWPVKVDPSQLDQVLANLCVNARDAISDVGKLTIETHNATFDQAYCADHLGFVPGDFVMLAVSDDGCGMDQETLSHIFEPFFTTKKMDKGTGLGLATVYGIAKQNDGFINIYSEPGQGSTLKIYLPRHEGMIDAMEQTTAAPKPMAHGETILVVEDDAGVLKLAAKILQGLGYTVLTTNTPAKALGLVEAHADRIELLLTDVVMPEMNGRELADQIQALCPQIKILFMSGYTADIIAHRGVLEKGVNFIHKPFSNWDLANAVRNVLDQA
jgi:two-component system, cell cycle sensor histidine kinase and response regulator CckA